LKGVWGMKEWDRTFENCCEWRVGNGKDILFWKDVWMGKEGNLESCEEWVNDSWEWKLV